MTSIGRNIAQRRIELEMTQEELALRMGYKSKTSINKIEKGINDIPQTKIVKFAEVLRTTPANLMGWVETKKPTENSGVSKKKQELINFLETVPDDKVDYVIRIMQTILQDDK